MKFTETGEVRIEVFNLGEMAEFRIIDTGAGIPSDQLESVFVTFSSS